MRIEVMRGHTKSLDANGKLIQTRSHVRNAIASRERQVVMRKVKSTITAHKIARFYKTSSGINKQYINLFRPIQVHKKGAVTLQDT